MKIKYLAVCCFLLIVNSKQVTSQILNPKKLLEKKLANKANQAIDKKAQQAVDSVFTDKDGTKAKENKQAGSDVQGQKVNNVTPGSGNQPSLQTFSKFDFVAGEKVIFFDDFTAENVGDFPVHWNTTGSGEVVTTNLYEGRWFNITNERGATTLDEAITLSDNYTIEFDVVPQKDPKNDNSSDFSFSILSTTKPKDLVYGLARPGEAAIRFAFEYSTRYHTYYRDDSPELSCHADETRLLPDNKYKISIWVQKERIRLYVDKEKIFDLPKAMSKNYKYNMTRFDRGITMIGNVRIATGLPDMRSKLMTEGKLVSYGIYFDVNSDKVKPESYGTLKGIANVLLENAGVKIKIIGHTDADGNDAANLDLSKRRAASVKNELVNIFGIDAATIDTDGKGETQPVVANDNITNKALNRRVEFIKQ